MSRQQAAYLIILKSIRSKGESQSGFGPSLFGNISLLEVLPLSCHFAKAKRRCSLLVCNSTLLHEELYELRSYTRQAQATNYPPRHIIAKAPPLLRQYTHY